MGEEEQNAESMGRLKERVKNIDTNLTQIGADLREYTKDNKESFRRLHKRADEFQDDLATSEIDMYKAITKVTDVIREGKIVTNLAIAATNKKVGILRRDLVWVGWIWRGVCALLIPIVGYIIIQLLKHVGG